MGISFKRVHHGPLGHGSGQHHRTSAIIGESITVSLSFRQTLHSGRTLEKNAVS